VPAVMPQSIALGRSSILVISWLALHAYACNRAACLVRACSSCCVQDSCYCCCCYSTAAHRCKLQQCSC
jgi:hypothetical protein